MEERCFRGYLRDPARCQLFLQGRFAGFVMAIPFILCFSLFGIFNLVGGTVLTIMSCRPKFSPKGMAFLQRLLHNSNLDLENQLDPMQMVGIILLLTGSLLVLVGVALGIVACRSVDEQRRRRHRSRISFSGLPMSSVTERSSRRASSISFTSIPTTRTGRNNRKRSLHPENVISPIMEVNSDEENMDNDGNCFGHNHLHSRTELQDISPSLSTQEIYMSPKKTQCSTWEKGSSLTCVEIVAEIQPLPKDEIVSVPIDESSPGLF